ncbi:MAG: hypothetical protein AAB888_01000 [Patescibacteria group bacterium]
MGIFIDVEKRICEQNLYPNTKESYGSEYQKHALEQYKIYIQSIDSVSDLKHKVNSYFLTINTILLGAVGLSLKRDDFFDPGKWHGVIPFIGVILCITWWYTTRSYKQVNRVKFKILHCLEEQLPFAVFKTEWKVIREPSTAPRGYTSETIEPVVPWIFITLYILIFFFVG